MQSITLYDTTLRDGCQSEDISFTLEDKLRIAEKLDALGIHYIEGSWPGSKRITAAGSWVPLAMRAPRPSRASS